MSGLPPNREVLEELKRLASLEGALPFEPMTPPIGYLLKEVKPVKKRSNDEEDFREVLREDRPLRMIDPTKRSRSRRFFDKFLMKMVIISIDMLVILMLLSIIVFFLFPAAAEGLLVELNHIDFLGLTGLISPYLVTDIMMIHFFYWLTLKVVARQTIGDFLGHRLPFCKGNEPSRESVFQ